jgi:hypothetical protein
MAQDAGSRKGRGAPRKLYAIVRAPHTQANPVHATGHNRAARPRSSRHPNPFEGESEIDREREEEEERERKRKRKRGRERGERGGGGGGEGGGGVI